MIYITGDTHGDLSDLQDRAIRVGAKEGDTFIICGDFGFVWGDDIDLKRLEDFPYTIAFIDGNHENFDRLYQ